MLPNSDRKLCNWKPERAARKAATRRQARTFTLTRAQVRKIVFDRAKGHCERCGRVVSFDVYPYKDDHAEVHEDPPRTCDRVTICENQVYVEETLRFQSESSLDEYLAMGWTR